MTIKKDTTTNSTVSSFKENVKPKKVEKSLENKSSKVSKHPIDTSLNDSKNKQRTKTSKTVSTKENNTLTFQGVLNSNLSGVEVETNNEEFDLLKAILGDHKPNPILQKKDKFSSEVKKKNFSEQINQDDKKHSQSKTKNIKTNSNLENKSDKVSFQKRDVGVKSSNKNNIVQKETNNTNSKDQNQKVYNHKNFKFNTNKHPKVKKEEKTNFSSNYKGIQLRSHPKFKKGIKHVEEFEKYIVKKQKRKLAKRRDILCNNLREIILKFPEIKDISKSFILNEKGNVRLQSKDGLVYKVIHVGNLLKLKYVDNKNKTAKVVSSKKNLAYISSNPNEKESFSKREKLPNSKGKEKENKAFKK